MISLPPAACGLAFHVGDCLDVLPALPAAHVHAVVTSPPYWAQRDYGHSLQIGQEPDPQAYVDNLVAAFAQVRRVLRDDGTLWLNLGDKVVKGQRLGLPWRVALALQADGWILADEIVWHKPSPMPRSEPRRTTVAHEQVFLLAKNPQYFFDRWAIAEPAVCGAKGSRFKTGKTLGRQGGPATATRPRADADLRLPRSVWTIAASPSRVAHFAAMPHRLVERCILAGTSQAGCCPTCGAPHERIVERRQVLRPRPNALVKREGAAGTGNVCPNTVAGVAITTTGWFPSGCFCAKEHLDPAATPPSVPCRVLDPFAGAGTTLAVARRLGRHASGIEINPAYAALYPARARELHAPDPDPPLAA